MNRIDPLFFVTFVFVVSPVFLVCQNIEWEQTSGPYTVPVLALIQNNAGYILAGTGSRISNIHGEGIYRTTDLGKTWIQMNNGLGNAYVYTLARHPNNTIYAGTAKGIYFSSDDGISWNQTQLVGSYPIYKIKVNRNGILIAISDNYIFRSTDNGNSWIESLSGSNRYTSLVIDRDQTIYLGIQYYGIAISTDEGQSWSRKYFGNHWLTSLGLDSNNFVYAGTSIGLLFRSSDHGFNWEKLSTEISGSFILDFVTSSNNEIFMGTTWGGVYKSSDAGNSWITVNTGLVGIGIYALLIDSSGIMFAGCNDGGVYRTKRSITAISEQQIVSSSTIHLNQNYPNPFSSSTAITYHLSSRGHVRLEVFDLLGRKIATVVDEEREAGEHEVKFTAGNVYTGIYFCRLISDGNAITRKMMVTQ